MKKAFKALWHGIKAVFTTFVDGLATLFGLKDNSKYGAVLRRVVGTAFAVVVVFWSLAVLASSTRSICRNTARIINCSDEDNVFLSEHLSDDITYYESYYGNDGYLVNADGKKVLKHIMWVYKPLGDDSLACFSDGEMRGYFCMRDGRVVVKPIFKHAWIFSDGLAAVDDEGYIKFINSDGRCVIDGKYPYKDMYDYVFHGGHCAVHDSTGARMGIIDREGRWVVEPIYKSIQTSGDFWLLELADRQAVLTFGLDTVLPLTPATFEFDDSVICATFSDHTMSTYSYDGELLESNQVRNVRQLFYSTREMVEFDVDCDECSYYNPATRSAVATCLLYEAAEGWYGLMSPDGRLVTPPSYSRVEAIGKDLYLCVSIYGRGVVVDSKGQLVK